MAASRNNPNLLSGYLSGITYQSLKWIHFGWDWFQPGRPGVDRFWGGCGPYCPVAERGAFFPALPPRSIFDLFTI
ncbi:MAG: hypothetical protein KGM98_14310 [Bacteroidota bacterium]|nr:hypothetical protein [Bacteroidota bacterium]